MNINSNNITREYLDSLMIETRHMNSKVPVTDFELFGEKFSSPIMTAALSHLDRPDHNGQPGMADGVAKGAKEAGCVLWYGMAEEEEIDRLSASGARMIEIIKTYEDRDIIFKKIEHAEKLGHLAVGIDIDHAYTSDGTPDNIHGYIMKALTTGELAEICRSTKLPLIVKGVLSMYDAEQVMEAGVSGLVVSHHNNRIESAIPPALILPEIVKFVNGRVPVFVDCMVQTGLDALKLMCLGAKGVCIGRPLMSAYVKDPENGVRDYLVRANDELRKAMAFTGCDDLSQLEPSIIHFPR